MTDAAAALDEIDPMTDEEERQWGEMADKAMEEGSLGVEASRKFMDDMEKRLNAPKRRTRVNGK